MRDKLVIPLKVVESTLSGDRFIVAGYPKPDINCPFYTAAWMAVYVKHTTNER